MKKAGQLGLLLVALSLSYGGLSAQQTAPLQDQELQEEWLNQQEAPRPKRPGVPRRHEKINAAAKLSVDEAEEIYSTLKDLLARGYGKHQDGPGGVYQSWTRYNTGPLRSPAHGRRYVNTYANAKAKDYGNYENANDFPVGAIVAKDSFAVTRSGEVKPGPVYIMEKMEAGFNPVIGDWRFSMILPTGILFGASKGKNSEGVQFCINCHLAAEDTNFLHLVPEEFRRQQAPAN